MKGGLATAESFVEDGPVVVAEEGLLFGGNGADFTSAAGVDWIELCCDYCGWRLGICGW